ncbi:MAG: YegP family protein [Bacteroides sp.]|nr:YegP family protein [Bacteroides sp.]
MAKFEIIKRKNGEFQFNLKADNGEIILTSEGYSAKVGCKNGIESVKTNSPKTGRYEKRESADNQYYFVLKASNGQIIGISEMYKSESSRDNGIASVMRNAPDAMLVDLSNQK